MTGMDVTSEDALKYLERLWLQWGAALIDKISSEYEIPEDIRSVLYQKFLRPNDWQVNVL